MGICCSNFVYGSQNDMSECCDVRRYVATSVQLPVDSSSASKIQLSLSSEATFRLRLACTAFKSSDTHAD